MNNLLTRSVTGLVFGIVMIGAALLGQQVAAILFFIVNYLGQKEFYNLLKSSGYKPDLNLGLTIGSTVYSLAVLVATQHIEPKYLVLFLPLVFFIFIVELWRRSPKPFTEIALTLTGVIYISIPLALLVGLFRNEAKGLEHYSLYLGYLFILWINDTFAYFTGSLIGKHKLFESISPKKTWEGSAGGALFAFLSAFVISNFFQSYSLWDWLFMAALIVLCGTLGDLVESMLKRSLGVKDSGAILPGHGGILDRFDAVFISVPFVYAYLTLIAA